MLPITDHIIEGLEPSDKRYDVDVEGDLVLCVLPNGSKTWVLLGADDTDARRHSLGVYPEMSILEACSSARGVRTREHPREAAQTDPRYVLRGGQVVENRTGNHALTLGVAAGVLVLLASGWLIVDTYRDAARSHPAVSSSNATPTIAGAADPEPRTDPAVSSPVSSSEPPRPAAAVAPAPAPAPGPQRDAPGPGLSHRPEATDPMADKRIADAADSLRDSVDSPDTTERSDDVVPPDIEPVMAVAVPKPTQQAATDTTPAVSARQSSRGGTASEPVSDKVARAQLTSGIRNREPVDNLGDSVSAAGSELGRVYFFTDLRNLDGSTVTHVWERDGEVQAQVPFDVGGWRWRVFSSKDILAGEAGRWRVTVVDEQGRVLAGQPFEFVAGLPAE